MSSRDNAINKCLIGFTLTLVKLMDFPTYFPLNLSLD